MPLLRALLFSVLLSNPLQCLLTQITFRNAKSSEQIEAHSFSAHLFKPLAVNPN
jgi:hypothetical protein